MAETTLNPSKSARIAASLFFFVCVPLSIWETGFVHAKIFVAQDPVTTANNLLTNEFIFRASIDSHFIGTITFIVLVLLFAKVLKEVNKPLAMLMVIPVLLQFPIVFVLEALNYTALMTLKGDPRITFDISQQQEAAYFLMRIHRYGFGADKIVFGLFLIPFGVLVLRSGFAPRVFGILIFIGGIGYVVDTCLYILLQRADYLLVQPLKLISSACYSISFLWFLIKGVRDPQLVVA